MTSKLGPEPETVTIAINSFVFLAVSCLSFNLMRISDRNFSKFTAIRLELLLFYINVILIFFKPN